MYTFYIALNLTRYIPFEGISVKSALSLALGSSFMPGSDYGTYFEPFGYLPITLGNNKDFF